MLEILILKTQHGGETPQQVLEEARKVLPFIKACDAFSLEGEFMTKEEAESDERAWNNFLTREISFSKFSRVLDAMYSNPPSIEMPQEILGPALAYGRKLHEYTFRSKKALYSVERWEKTEADKLKRAFNYVITRAFGFKLIRQGRIEEGVRHSYQAIQGGIKYMDARDQHIAKNLENAETILRNTYAWLKDKEVIKLTVQIGSNHEIERYAKIPIDVLPLTEIKPTEENLALAYDMVRKGKSLVELAPFLIKAAAAEKN